MTETTTLENALQRLRFAYEPGIGLWTEWSCGDLVIRWEIPHRKMRGVIGKFPCAEYIACTQVILDALAQLRKGERRAA